MKYLHTIWSNNNDDECGVFFYYEIDDDSYVNRQIEIYKDFSYGIASVEFEIGKIYLSSAKIENVEQVVTMNDPDIDSFMISAAHFNSVWKLLLGMSKKDGNEIGKLE